MENLIVNTYIGYICLKHQYKLQLQDDDDDVNYNVDGGNNDDDNGGDNMKVVTMVTMTTTTNAEDMLKPMVTVVKMIQMI
mgnify:FL=1